jgi:hypothetical protein
MWRCAERAANHIPARRHSPRRSPRRSRLLIGGQGNVTANPSEEGRSRPTNPNESRYSRAFSPNIYQCGKLSISCHPASQKDLANKQPRL